MSKGFRKSLFGFNPTDVLSYIAATDAAAKTKIDELTQKLNTLTNENNQLKEQNAVLKEQSDEYESKKEHIRIMSENVARIYLTAKETSKLMIEKADESRKLIDNENKEHLETLNKASESMNSVKEKISLTAKDYCNELEKLCLSLENIKNEIDKNGKDVETAISDFSALVSEQI